MVVPDKNNKSNRMYCVYTVHCIPRVYPSSFFPLEFHKIVVL